MYIQKLFIIPALAASILLMYMANAYASEPPTFKASVGELKKITFKLANNTDQPQPFVNIIQVKNKEAFVEQLSWVQGMLQPRQELRPQQSWIPEKPGEYTIDIFVWESIDGTPISPSLLMNVNVEV
jgi:hypothetical protein